MPNVYSPARNVFAQHSYFDQQGTALAGSLAFASDSRLVDSFITAEPGENGLETGRAVVALPITASLRAGLNSRAVALPGETARPEDIIGITVRSHSMSTNAYGNACAFTGDMCNVARVGRSGARLWARLVEGAAPAEGGTVYVAIGGDNAGKLAAEAGAGFAAVPGMIFRSGAENGIALVELL